MRRSGFSVGALCLVLGLTTLFVPGLAAASEPARFEYDAPVECPNEEAFVERVRERSLYGRFAADGELARTFVVTIQVDESGATARVDFVDADGSAVFRRVRGSTCEEAVSGIALVTALAIDGRATPEEQATPTAIAPGAPPPAVAAPAQPPPKVVNAAPPVPAGPARNEALASTLSINAGIGVGYASHRAPSGAPTFDAFAGGRLSDYGPSARVSLWHFRSDATSAGRQARFRGYGLRLEACPLAIGSRPWFFEPCLAVDAGVLLASGVEGAGVADANEYVRGFGDVLAIARAGTLLGASLFFEAQGELSVSLVADRYGFGDPPVEPHVFEVPRVGVSARGAVGFRFR